MMLTHQPGDTYIAVTLMDGKHYRTTRTQGELVRFLRSLRSGTAVVILHVRSGEAITSYFPTEVFDTHPGV